MRTSYPTYKSTTIPWLPEMPKHWDLIGLNLLFRDNKNKNKGMVESQVLSLSYGNIIRKKREENFGLVPESFETYQILEPGYIVMRLTDLQNDKRSLRVGYVKERGIITSAYTGLVPGKIDSKYYYYLLHYLDIRKHFYSLGGGVRQSSDYNEIKKTKVPLPPPSEQTAIANYLDAKTEQINRFIEKKEKLIALLKEQKQAVLNDAVTKGVNEKATFQETDSVWFKEIPSHWKTVKFNHYVYLKHGFQFRDFDFKDEGIKVVKISQLKSDGSLDLSECSFIDSNRINEFKEIKISKGDILMALTGGTIGKIILVSDVNETLLMNYRVGSFYPTKPKELSKEYLFLLLSSNIIFGQIMFAQRETGQPNIGKEDFRKMRFPIPPSLNEQDEIVKYIKEQSKNIDLIISRVEREIEKVKELKQSLIAEVITGRIKVA